MHISHVLDELVAQCDGMPMQVHRTTYTVMRSVLEDDETRGRSVLSLSLLVIVIK